MNKKSVKWEMPDGVTLHVEILEAGKPNWMVVTHGLGEHCGRQAYLANIFQGHYNMLWWDLRGHGQSGGRRCFVDKFEQYAKDLREILLRLQKDFHLKNYVLFGHSMGAMITCDFMQNFCPNDLYPDKVFLSAPPVSLPGPGGLLIKYGGQSLLNHLASFPLSLALPGLVNPKGLSHDPKVDVDYVNDPLNCRAMHTRLAFNLGARARQVFSRPLRLRCPSYCIYGTKDPLVDSQAIGNYFSKFEKNTEVKVVQNGFHELHNETPEFRRPFIEFLTSKLLPQESVLD